MNILTMLWKNLWGGARSMRFPARPTVSERYRGLVCFDATLCTGCSMCAFHCTSRAINFRSSKTEYKWSYDPGQCTYCGRCAEGCESHALSMEAKCPPVYLRIGELKTAYTVPRKLPPPKPAATPPTATGEPNANLTVGGAI